MNWSEKCAKIQAIVTDVDGVLTDGCIGYGMGSDDELKFFNVKDGAGFRLASVAGLKIAALTGRVSKANRRRLTELKFDVIKEKVLTKGDGIRELCAEWGIGLENCMYLGDDLIDLPVFELVGLSVAVADAAELVKERADWVTSLPGGHGACREAIERLLRERGEYESVVAAYLGKECRPKDGTGSAVQ